MNETNNQVVENTKGEKQRNNKTGIIIIVVLLLAVACVGGYFLLNKENKTPGSSVNDKPTEQPIDKPTEEPKETYGVKCTNKKDLSIYDIYHYDDVNGEWTGQISVPGTYTPDMLEMEITSYFLTNSEYACEYIKYNENTENVDGGVIAYVTEEDMQKAIEKLYGQGNYKRYESLALASPDCVPFTFDESNKKYELFLTGGCGGTSTAEEKVTNKEIKTEGEYTIVTEYITIKESDNTGKTSNIKIEYTVRTSDKVLIKIVTTKA